MRLVFRFVTGLWIILLSAGMAGASGIPGAVEATLALYSNDDRRAFLGSGFVFGADGLRAVSNAHVVGDADSVQVEFHDGKTETARVIARDAQRDIAVLALSGRVSGLLSADAIPAPGTLVFAVGAPLGQTFTLTRGIVSAHPRQVEPQVPLRLIQHDAAINPGSSGGPLVDGQGRLVGMNSRIADGSRLFVGIGFAIQAADLDRLVPQLVAGRLRPVPQLGLDLRPVDARIARAMRISAPGVLVDNVASGGLADRAGVQAGDILLRADGQQVTKPGDLAFELDIAGDTAIIDLNRGGEVQQVLLPLPSNPTGNLAKPAGENRALTFFQLSVAFDADAVVSHIDAGSALANAGLTTGDQIQKLNGRSVTSDDLAQLHLSAPFVMLVSRDGRHLHVIADPWSQRQPRIPLGAGNRLDMSVVRF